MPAGEAMCAGVFTSLSLFPLFGGQGDEQEFLQCTVWKHIQN